MTYKEKLLAKYPHLKEEHISKERRDTLSRELFIGLLKDLSKR